MSFFDLKDRVALITGSSTGLGKAIARVFGEAGAKVTINYFNNLERAVKTQSEFEAAEIDNILVKADVTTEEGVDELYRRTEDKLGKPDILVINATCSQPHKTIEDYDWDFHQDMLDFFVKSPYLLTRRGLAHMKEQQWGRIINIASEVFHKSVSPFSAYVAAKGGQIGWSRSMSQELAPFGITVNVVAPGWVPVERHQTDPQETKDAYRDQIPADRWGVPDDVAYACLYFASDEASFITGQTLCVNGGVTPW